MGGDVRAAVVAAGPRLPRKDLSRLYPATMQDAVAVVHARLEDNKKKAAASKQKSKSKAGAPGSLSDSHFPGARPGGGDPSAFWMYIEVSWWLRSSGNLGLSVVGTSSVHAHILIFCPPLPPLHPILCRTTSGTSHRMTCARCCQ